MFGIVLFNILAFAMTVALYHYDASEKFKEINDAYKSRIDSWPKTAGQPAYKYLYDKTFTDEATGMMALFGIMYGSSLILKYIFFYIILSKFHHKF